MAIRISSQDVGYQLGQLSLYPVALDSKNQLYTAKNNAITALKHSLTYTGKYIIVDDATDFPDNGILRIGSPPGKYGPSESVYYESKQGNTFKDIIRGFSGSKQTVWPAGSVVSCAVFADHHNSVKDAILQVENNLGVAVAPATGSLNEILRSQEAKFLAPKALFRAYPTTGAPLTTVRFQNFSTGPVIRYFWDFGDGTTSSEKSPTHTYQKEGIYSVQLNIITSLGAQGYATKSNYITISQDSKEPFIYVIPSSAKPYKSIETAKANGGAATVFTLVDQTDGDITQRWWNLDGDGIEVDGINAISTNGTTVFSSSSVTNIPSTSVLSAGMVVTGDGIKGGTTVQSIDSDTAITLNKTASISGTGSLQFFSTSANSHVVNTVSITNPNTHTLKFMYNNLSASEYNPSLLILLGSQVLKKAYINSSNSLGSGLVIT